MKLLRYSCVWAFTRRVFTPMFVFAVLMNTATGEVQMKSDSAARLGGSAGGPPPAQSVDTGRNETAHLGP